MELLVNLTPAKLDGNSILQPVCIYVHYVIVSICIDVFVLIGFGLYCLLNDEPLQT